MPGIVKACRRPRRFARATGLAASQGFRTASPAARDAGASPRHALLAENLGKPSLWVITKDLWYNAPRAGENKRLTAGRGRRYREH